DPQLGAVVLQPPPHRQLLRVDDPPPVLVLPTRTPDMRPPPLPPPRHVRGCTRAHRRSCRDAGPYGALSARRTRRGQSNKPAGGSITTRPASWNTTKRRGTRPPVSSTSRSLAGFASTAVTVPRSVPSASTTCAPTRSC